MDELQSVFDRWDIEVVVLSELSVSEQIELFSEAELVIGVHGAGFANFIYTYDAHIIELFGMRRLNTYARLCEIMGVAHEHPTCAQYGVHVHVDTTRLEQRFDAWAAR
jgi:capsular polysaccharide biosynthesis protein